MQQVDDTASRGALPVNGQGALVGLVLLFLVAFYPSFQEITIEWFSNGPYSHGALAVALIGYIVWQERALLSETRPSIGILALLCALGGGSLWLVSSLVHVQLGRFVGLFGLFIGCIWMIYGWRTLLSLWLPLTSLALVLPVWNPLQIPLQELSSDVTEFVLRVLDIPVLREGFLFTLPGGNFIVEEACSGLGFLLTSMLLALFYGYINRVERSRTVLLFVFAILFAIFSNWIRIVAIMIVGNETNMDHPIVTDHLTFGWIVFAVLLIPFFAVAHYVSGSAIAPANTVSGAQGGAGVLNLPVVIIALGVVLAFVGMKYFLMIPPDGSQTAWTPPGFDRLGRTSEFRREWTPHFIGADLIDIRSGETDGAEFEAMLVRYDTQSQGKELIFVENRLYDPDRWRKQEERVVMLPDSEHEARVVVLRRGREERMIAYWYVVAGGMVTVDARMVKLGELAGYFSGDRTSYLVAVSMQYAPAEREARSQALLQTAAGLID